MSGEILREAGVLLFVFAPLDAIFAPNALTVVSTAVIVVEAAIFMAVGILPATILGGTLVVVSLYLKWTLYRDERRNRRQP